MRRTAAGFAALFLLVLVARLCHVDLLWVEEAYPAAGALQVLHGRALYRDVWFDKPPLSAYAYLLWGAWEGWPLRVAGAAYVTLSAGAAYGFATAAWGVREGRVAAALLAFFLTFGVPAAVMALSPDLLMIAPHLTAVWMAWRGRPVLAGLLAGVCLGIHTKGLFVLAACLLWQAAAAHWVLLGAAITTGIGMLPTIAAGALADYWRQVWSWGSRYSADTLHAQPWREGVRRTAAWAGFHAAPLLGVGVALGRTREDRWRWAGWVALSLASVGLGQRYFPRYYFHLLPVVVLLGARGLCLMGRHGVWVALLLLVPLGRYGPRYVTLARDLAAVRPHTWSDLALNQDARRAAAWVQERAGPNDTLLVWGYRPDVFLYTRLAAGTRYLDSQPLTGVLADRHLVSSRPTFAVEAVRERLRLATTAPTWVVDGLGPLNPALAIDAYPELRAWRERYREVGRVGTGVVYRRVEP